ncbi:MAG TPA: AtpZ/AtpI family protein [Vicinamibacterales bacterium]
MSASDVEPPEDPLARRIAHRAERRRQARRHRERGTWFGLGMYGMVGWSIAIPTVLGVAAGIWVDARWPSRFSWTLMLMIGGLLVGCWNAWYWISVEQREIRGPDDEETKKRNDE